MSRTSALPSDIVTCIFEHIDRNTTEDGMPLPLDREARKAMYNAALVNRTFANAVIPMLWGRITSFKPLFLVSGLAETPRPPPNTVS
jgi:hypothetical protein